MQDTQPYFSAPLREEMPIKKLVEVKRDVLWADLYTDGYWDAGFYNGDYMDAQRMRQAAQELLELADIIDNGRLARLQEEASA